jgi:elongation factor 1 alpha-like protein
VSSSSYPIDYAQIPPPLQCSVPFSAADFFRDTPWLNVPQHRKANIIIEPLYPRLGLLGGAAQEGKISKLAALAAARKKKNIEKPAEGTEGPPQPQSVEQKPTSRSLSERLAVNNARPSARPGGLSALTRDSRLNGGRVTSQKSTPTVPEPDKKTVPQPSVDKGRISQEAEPKPQQPRENIDLRAVPSTFAATIVGDGGPSTTLSEPSHHLLGSSFDVMHIYQQDVTEAFDFAGPSPDDVVLNAQSASKGLPIRAMR